MPSVKPLIPVDKKRCQAEHTVSTNFMTLGGPSVGTMERCSSRPDYIATEKKPTSSTQTQYDSTAGLGYRT
jgi:hypothetical protein